MAEPRSIAIQIDIEEPKSPGEPPAHFTNVKENSNTKLCNIRGRICCFGMATKGELTLDKVRGQSFDNDPGQLPDSAQDPPDTFPGNPPVARSIQGKAVNFTFDGECLIGNVEGGHNQPGAESWVVVWAKFNEPNAVWHASAPKRFLGVKAEQTNCETLAST